MTDSTDGQPADGGQPEPLSDERLAEIAERANWLKREPPRSPPRHGELEQYIRDLLDEVERLHRVRDAAMNLWLADRDRWHEREAALLAVVVRLASTPGKLCCRFDCNINERWSAVFPERWSQHADDCLVTQARAALAAPDAE